MAHENLFKIYIPDPCFEDWNKMTPNEQGAFCKVCSKTVVDFSGKSDEEIQKYILANIDKKICGRFKTSQVEENEEEIPKLKVNLNEGKYSFPSYLFPLNTQFRAAALALMLCAGSLMYGCSTSGTAGGDDHKLTGAVELRDDTVKTQNDTLNYNELNRIQGGVTIKDAQRLNYLQDTSKSCDPVETRTVGKIKVVQDTVKTDTTETMLKGEIAPRRKMGIIKKSSGR
jgi:hypothetical protein